MIILQRDSRYEVGDPDCVFKVKSGDLITPIKRIGYKTTFDDWEDYGEITDEDIKDFIFSVVLTMKFKQKFIFQFVQIGI